MKGLLKKSVLNNKNFFNQFGNTIEDRLKANIQQNNNVSPRLLEGNPTKRPNAPTAFPRIRGNMRTGENGLKIKKQFSN